VLPFNSCNRPVHSMQIAHRTGLAIVLGNLFFLKHGEHCYSLK
jgi:hypothetical protein